MKAVVKRALDIIIAAPALLVLSPLLAVAMLGIRLTMGGPVIFRQVRPGLHGRPFTIYKLRTMQEPPTGGGQRITDEQRLTALGRFLRSTSMDEVPELYNVLRGDMSLVGPRPLLMEYLPLYTPSQARRHEVRPGLTGWAQVNGRNAISWEEKFRLDVWYVDNHSLGLDLKIIVLTLYQVVRRHGVSPGDQQIMPRFRGSEDVVNRHSGEV